MKSSPLPSCPRLAGGQQGNESALAAADGLSAVLDAAPEFANERAAARDATMPRSPKHDPHLLNGSAGVRNRWSGVEPPKGIEPLTCSLRGGCMQSHLASTCNNAPSADRSGRPTQHR